MELKTITINYSSGVMNIYPEEAFPAKKGWLKSWLKVALEDEKSREILEDVSNHIRQQLGSCEQEKSRFVKFFIDARQNYTDLKTLLRTKKYPNGSLVKSEDLPTEKQLELIEREMNRTKKEIVSIQKIIDKYTDNLNTIQETITKYLR